MILINFDLATGLAKLAQTTVIKQGADIPVRVVFSATPGEVSGLQLGLGKDTTDTDRLLAFTDTFTAENDTTWTAVLDGTDTRLHDFMQGKGPTAVLLEFSVILDGEHQVAPNLSVTVQPPIIPQDPTTEGGPTWYTTTESDARFLGVAADGPLTKRGTATVANAAESKAVAFSTPFGAAPSTVMAWLMVPSSGAIIACAVDWSTITANGFTAVFGAATPNANYKLGWLAIA
jgi:hypothetical protein